MRVQKKFWPFLGPTIQTTSFVSGTIFHTLDVQALMRLVTRSLKPSRDQSVQAVMPRVKEQTRPAESMEVGKECSETPACRRDGQ